MCFSIVRKINWRKFKPVRTVHIDCIRNIDIVAYDQKGRLYEKDLANPNDPMPMLFWACIMPLGNWLPIDIGFNYDGYVFGWRGKRLSSLPEHEYYWRECVWFTEGDRDFMFNSFTKEMF